MWWCALTWPLSTAVDLILKVSSEATLSDIFGGSWQNSPPSLKVEARESTPRVPKDVASSMASGVAFVRDAPSASRFR